MKKQIQPWIVQIIWRCRYCKYDKTRTIEACRAYTKNEQQKVYKMRTKEQSLMETEEEADQNYDGSME